MAHLTTLRRLRKTELDPTLFKTFSPIHFAENNFVTWRNANLTKRQVDSMTKHQMKMSKLDRGQKMQ
jgi:hypothetical protein